MDVNRPLETRVRAPPVTVLTKTSGRPLPSPETRSLELLQKLTLSPAGEMRPSLPPSATSAAVAVVLRRVVAPEVVLKRKTSVPPLVSPATRVLESLVKVIRTPFELMEAL